MPFEAQQITTGPATQKMTSNVYELVFFFSKEQPGTRNRVTDTDWQ